MRLKAVILFILCLLPESAEVPQQLNTGVLNGAAYRIAVPTTWNGTLILFLPGYADRPTTFSAAAPVGAVAEHLIRRGALYAEAGYHAGGWAVAEAIEDVERLRSHIATRFGTPKRVILIGESMGGTIALALLEKDPRHYQGGLAFCGGTIAAYDYFKRGAFDLLMVFDALFPSILPPADNIPRSFGPSEQVVSSVVNALERNPDRAVIVQALAPVSDVASLAELLVLHTAALKELTIRAGGNPFDNTQSQYPVLMRDGRTIADVRRVKSRARAERYLRQFYTPTGALRRPFVAVSVTSDPVVPRWATGAYPKANPWFVQWYVEGAGHCAVTAGQRLAAFEALETWIDHGRRPSREP